MTCGGGKAWRPESLLDPVEALPGHQFIEDGEVQARELIGDVSLTAVSGFGFEPVDEIDDVVEPAARAGTEGETHDTDEVVFMERERYTRR